MNGFEKLESIIQNVPHFGDYFEFFENWLSYINRILMKIIILKETNPNIISNIKRFDKVSDISKISYYLNRLGDFYKEIGNNSEALKIYNIKL